MPVYDYRCYECDAVSQFEMPLGSLDDQVCPECGGVAKRVFQIFETPPKIGGGACSQDGFDDGDSCSCTDSMLESLAAFSTK